MRSKRQSSVPVPLASQSRSAAACGDAMPEAASAKRRGGAPSSENTRKPCRLSGRTDYGATVTPKPPFTIASALSQSRSRSLTLAGAAPSARITLSPFRSQPPLATMKG